MIKQILAAILGATFFLGHAATAQTITIVNPILTGFYPDPSVVQVGTDYYLVNSTFSYFPGIPVFHSKDLKNWKQISNVIARPSQMDFMGEKLTRDLFAPAISFHNGMYYLYAGEGGASVNHTEVVFRSKSVWGPFVPYENNPMLTQRGLPDNRKDPITSAGHAPMLKDTANFFYGLDGKSWLPIGKSLKMSYTIPHFMGYRFGLFNYATKNVGGYADFDFFSLEDKVEKRD